MPPEQIVNQLLSHWEERREEGTEISAEDLCRDHPHLLDEVRRQIAALRAFGSFSKTPPPCDWTLDAGQDGRPGVLAGLDIPGYEILGELGRGGMGVVYKARQVKLRRLVALKMILGVAHAGLGARARFLREAEAVARLQHPNIVQVFELGEHQGQPFCALEFVEGGSLEEKLRGQPQSPRASAQLLRTLAQAVQAAHQAGVVHRDLKPANVLLAPVSRVAIPTSDEENAKRQAGATDDFVPKIADFGLAKRLSNESGRHPTLEGAIVGTPSYMAPEQAAGAATVGPAADLYTLGAILYEMLTGRPPFKGTTIMETLQLVLSEDPCPPSQLQPKVPADLETICLKCLHKEPSRRYATAQDLADDLGRFLAGEPVRARPVGALEQAWRWCRRRPALASLAAALVIAVAGGFAGVFTLWRVAEGRRQEALGESHRAEYHRGLAEQRAAEARTSEKRTRKAHEETLRVLRVTSDAVDRLSKLVHDHPQMRSLALEPVRLSALELTTTYYDSLLRLDVASDNPELVLRLQGPAHLGLARALDRKASLLKAVDSAQRAIAVSERLVKIDPHNDTYQRDLAEGHRQLGLLYSQLARHDEALAAHRRSLGVVTALARARPGDLSLALFEARCATALGSVHWSLRQLDEAEKSWRGVLTISCRLLDRQPASTEVQAELARAYSNLGVVYSEQGKQDSAQRVWLAALEARLKLARGQPRDPLLAEELATSWNNLGTLYHRRAQHSRALAAWQSALAIRQEQARLYPLIPENRAVLASSHVNLGVAYQKTNQLPQARQALLAALGIYRGLLDEGAQLPGLALGFARATINLAEVLHAQSESETAVGALGQAIAGLELYRKVDAKGSEARELLSWAHWKRANLHDHKDRHREAVRDWERALEHDNGSRRNFLTIRLATTLAHLGDHVRAGATAARVLGRPGLPASLRYQTAQVYALSATALLRDQRVPLAVRECQARRLVDRAVQLLGTAEVLAFLRSTQRGLLLPTHSSWQSLRGHPDFARLCEQARGK
jgi:tetratricopeptide (TPR) repeat protein